MKKHVIIFYPKQSQLNKKHKEFDNDVAMNEFVEQKVNSGFICDHYSYESTFQLQTNIIQTKE